MFTTKRFHLFDISNPLSRFVKEMRKANGRTRGNQPFDKHAAEEKTIFEGEKMLPRCDLLCRQVGVNPADSCGDRRPFTKSCGMRQFVKSYTLLTFLVVVLIFKNLEFRI